MIFMPQYIPDKFLTVIDWNRNRNWTRFIQWGLNFDFNGLQKDLDNRNTEACGGGPIVAMMKAAALKDKNQALVVHRSDSGDVSGDNREVVGYLSAVIYWNWSAPCFTQRSPGWILQKTQSNLNPFFA